MVYGLSLGFCAVADLERDNVSGRRGAWLGGARVAGWVLFTSCGDQAYSTRAARTTKGCGDCLPKKLKCGVKLVAKSSNFRFKRLRRPHSTAQARLRTPPTGSLEALWPRSACRRRAIATMVRYDTTNRHACTTPIRTIYGATSWFAPKRRPRRARAGLSSCFCRGCGAALGPRACSSGVTARHTNCCVIAQNP